MKSILGMIAVLLSAVTLSAGQVRNALTETVKVFGNCSVCKSAIEKAGSKKTLNQTVWDADTKMATITYDSKRTNPGAVLKSIALAGYDNAVYLAPDDVYEQLGGCCKYERTAKRPALTNQSGNPENDDHTIHEAGVVGQVQQAPHFKTVFDQYFALKDALVKSDGNKASAAAGELVTALEAVEMSKLGATEHTAWMKVEKQLKSNARHITENKDIEHQRSQFITLSSGMYELVKAARPAEAVYYQHCPMANDGKGANWLSKESVIKNPYYGNMMLSCGKTVEIIKQ